MNGFLWAYDHLGWGIFSVTVFTVLWWLLGDLVWRLKNIGFGRFLAAMFSGWLVGVGLIVLGFFLGSR
ncbi:MAG TPA: hypothetical protein VFG67_00670 [Oleiagrimonas sp.]|nr:hypothetical protein [Oleiagrimonas sp.]